MENHPRTEDPYHSPRYTHNSTKVGPGESPRELAQPNQDDEREGERVTIFPSKYSDCSVQWNK